VAPKIDWRDAALLCAETAYEKKATDIRVLDVSKILVITSYFVIATAESRKQLQAIADSIHEKLKPLGFRRMGTEGLEEGKWVLLDYGDVIVQLFDPTTRRYYNLEEIWADAPRVAFTPKAASASA
jgi:ribosome-associated protein